ncbi:hypothetical protein [Pontibacter mangrovi]|uniref:Uncharacterized protein n=1 Tax=Pontibacter mangrovi TaxID=2589816 RepID=A0A501W5N2_9BACT|nr:hypothetical protein [Pontibacter mangrovi]TPE42127.1 hypothetical protein FJM65_18760 [Pontibacter mangrovi]
MRHLFLPLLASIVFLCAGCKKEASDNPNIETVDATLHWTGEFAVDGCGFTLEIGNTTHKVINDDFIPDSFKDNTPVEVEAKIVNYHTLGRYCRSALDINKVKVLELRKR